VSDHQTFGRFLSQQRELRGLSRDAVAQATRIPPTLIAALEDGLPQRLPERIFVLNYIKSYAQVVGLSYDEAVTRYEEIDGVQAAPEASPKELEKRRRKRAYVSLAVFTVLAAIGTYAAMVFYGELPNPFP
jgi:cytoskeletal protein RodZ